MISSTSVEYRRICIHLVEPGAPVLYDEPCYVSGDRKHRTPDLDPHCVGSRTWAVSVTENHCVMICYDMLWHVVTCYVMLWHVVTGCEMLWHVVTCYDMLWHVMTCYVILWHVVTCCEMLWHVVTCYDMLWHFMTCCDMLWHAKSCNQKKL